MNTDESKRFRADLADVIGEDIVYVSAADEAKHFDGIAFVQQYGGELFLLFATSAATAVFAALKERIKKEGKRLGDAISAKFNALLSTPVAARDDKEQIQHIGNAHDVLDNLKQELGESFKKEFVEAGREALQKRLIRDNLPEEKARLISGNFAKAVEESI